MTKEDDESVDSATPESMAWQYGYGELDETATQLKGFQPLPHFTGSAWQGSSQYPDPALGWVQLAANGGHPGNDLKHCSIRRWVAPHDGTYTVASMIVHDVAEGNGIRCLIFTSRHGMQQSRTLHNQRYEMNVAPVELQRGDSIDFVVDINSDLNNDQYEWSPVIHEVTQASTTDTTTAAHWDATRDFSGPVMRRLTRWEQVAQVLLIANELMFRD